jgi:hypothetical protein
MDPSENVLKSDSGKSFVKYFPPNVTAVIQPIDQGVIPTMQSHVRGSLLQNYVNEGSDFKMLWKKLSLMPYMRCHMPGVW